MKKILITVCTISFILGSAVFVNESHAAVNNLKGQVPQAIETQQNSLAKLQQIADSSVDGLEPTCKCKKGTKKMGDGIKDKVISIKDSTTNKFNEIKDGTKNTFKRGKDCPKKPCNEK